LGLKKYKEGKDHNTIKKEINFINEFQRDMKETKKLIIKKDKEIETLKNKIKKLQKELFDKKLYEETKTKRNNSVSLGELNKIIALVSEEKLPGHEIKNLCNLNQNKLGRALSFLIKDDIIEESKKCGMKLYKKK